MGLKTLFFSLTILATVPAYAAKKNVCDDLIAAGKSTEQQIKKCLEKFGESAHYKEQAQKKKWAAEADATKANEEEQKKSNIEMKKFTSNDLADAGFGKPFFAMKVDYSNQYNPKEKRITEGDTLCKYLGYQKAVKSILSAEVLPADAHQNGLIVDTSWLGNPKSEPELFDDNNINYTVRKYTEITCAKVISKDIAGTEETLKSIPEILIRDINDVNVGINAPKKDDGTSHVDNSGRKPAIEGKTPNGYKKPDWAQSDESAKGTGK